MFRIVAKVPKFPSYSRRYLNIATGCQGFTKMEIAWSALEKFLGGNVAWTDRSAQVEGLGFQASLLGYFYV